MSKLLRTITLLPFMALLVVERTPVLAQVLFPPVLPKPGIRPPEKGALPPELTSGGSLRGQIMKYLNYTLTFVGIIGVIVVVYAGFLYLTSFGSTERSGQAKKAIGYAVAGILMILLSYVIVNAVIRVPIESNITGSGNGFPDPD